MDVTPISSSLMVLMFTDVVNSTGIKSAIGAEAYGELVARQDRIVHRIVSQTPGARVLQDMGDGYFIAFQTVGEAVAAALTYQYWMHKEAWPHPFTARVGLHLGQVARLESQSTGGTKVFASAVDLAARVMSLGTGGQILLSRVVFDEARQFVHEHPVMDGVRPIIRWIAHGPYLFKGADEPMEIFEVGAEGIAPLTPPPDGEKARRHIRPGEEQTLGWRPGVDRPLPSAPNWHIRRKLGEGGFGEVWLAEHDKTRAARVFKFCFDAERLRALKREVVLFRLLKETLGDRRDIGRVVDWQFEESPYFIEMDYAPLGNLEQWSAAAGGIQFIPAATRLKIVAQVAQALAAAHSVGILHKDIKPTNVLMLKDAEENLYPRLTDFGIGTLTDRARLGDFNITMAGFTDSNFSPGESLKSGTAMYAPPESLAGKPHTIQGDVYALGVLLYQMAVGDLHKPLAPGWERDVTDELLRGDIAACVDGQPQSRLQSAHDLAQRLMTLEERRRAQRERAEAAAAEASERRQARIDAQLAARRKRTIRLLTASVASLAAVAISFSILLWQLATKTREAQDNQAKSIKQEKIATGEAERAKRAEGIAQQAETLARQHLAAEYVNRGIDAQIAGQGARALSYFVRALEEEAGDADAGAVHRARIAQMLAQCPRPCAPMPQLEPNLPVSPEPRLIALDGRVLRRRDGDGVVWQMEDRDGKVLASFRQSEKRIVSASLSPDGKRVITGGIDQTAMLWDAHTGKPIAPGLKHGGTVAFVGFAPDGKVAVTASGDGTAKLWNGVTGEIINEPLRHGAAVTFAAFSWDGRQLVTLCRDHTLRVWDASSGNAITPAVPYFRPASSIAFSPDGRRLLLVSDDHTARLFDAGSGDGIGQPMKHQAAITSACFGPDSSRIVTASADHTARLWDASGQATGAAMEHPDEVLHASFSPDSQLIVTGCKDTAARIWKVQNGQLAGPRIGHRAAVRAAAFGPDGRRLVTSVWDYAAFAWNLPERALPAPDAALDVSPVNVATFDPAGYRMITLGTNQPGVVWDLSGAQRMAKLAGHHGTINAVAFDAAGRIATAGEDQMAIVWREDGLAQAFAPLPHEDAVKLIAFSSDGLRLITATRTSVSVWDARSGAPLARNVKGDGGLIVALSPDATRFVAIKSQGAQVFDALRGGKVGDGMSHKQVIHQAAFSHDGRRVVTASQDYTARVWDASSGQPISAEPLRHEGPVFFAAFSPDDRRVATGSRDHTARVWDAASGKPVTPPMVHDSAATVRRLAFSPDGRFLATATDFFAARVWDARNGQSVGGTFAHPVKVVEEIAFSPDSRRLVTVAEDRRLRVWDFGTEARPVGELRDLAQLLSGHWLDETGGETPIKPEAFARLLKDLAGKYPGEFLPPATPQLAEATLANRNLEERLLVAIARWFAGNRSDAWAIKLYEAVQQRGGAVDWAEVGFCKWRSGDERGAVGAFETAMKDLPASAWREHLRRCLAALKAR